MSKLKLCPSCNHGAAFYGVDSYYVECCNCGLRTKRFRTGKEAIAAWNRRAQPANEPLTCEGCENEGKYEDEREYGYPSPCTRCKRVMSDNYRRQPERSENK